MIRAVKKQVKAFARYGLETWNAFKNNACALKAALFRKKKVIIYAQTPLHRNVGDLAIAEATLDWLKSCFPTEEVIEYTYAEMHLLYRLMLHLSVRKDDVLVLHGGGNLGVWYPKEEQYRQSIIRMFPRNPVVIMPQSVYLGDASEDTLKQFENAYAKHPSLLLCARDTKSYDLTMQKIKCQCTLTPDIVLSFAAGRIAEEGARERGILLCLRNDREKKVGADFQEQVITYCTQELKEKIVVQDTHINKKINRGNRRETVLDMLQHYRNASLVITDRFHGGIFAYITGTPCIVIEAADHKVKGGYDWLRRAGNIMLLNDLDQIKQAIPKLIGKTNTPVLYESEFDRVKVFLKEGLERQA